MPPAPTDLKKMDYGTLTDFLSKNSFRVTVKNCPYMNYSSSSYLRCAMRASTFSIWSANSYMMRIALIFSNDASKDSLTFNNFCLTAYDALHSNITNNS